MKERSQRYKLDEMLPGDRFYFVGDRKKIVHAMRLEQPFETLKLAGYWKRFGYCIQDGSSVADRHLANRFVIFLRNIDSV